MYWVYGYYSFICSQLSRKNYIRYLRRLYICSLKCKQSVNVIGYFKTSSLRSIKANMLSQFFLTLKWKRWKHRTLLSFSDTRGLNTKGMEAERAVNTKYFEGDFLTFSSHWLRVFIQSANVFCFPFLVKVNFSNFPTGRDFLSMILQNGGYNYYWRVLSTSTCFSGMSWIRVVHFEFPLKKLCF